MAIKNHSERFRTIRKNRNSFFELSDHDLSLIEEGGEVLLTKQELREMEPRVAKEPQWAMSLPAIERKIREMKQKRR